MPDFSMSAWAPKQKVGLLEAFGINRGTATPPSLTASLPGAVAHAGDAEAGETPSAQLTGFVSGSSSPGSGGGSNGTPSANMALANSMAAAVGWGAPNQIQALDSLWTGESGFRTDANNPSSGAYGIPQALPGSKMAAAGSDWMTNPITQITWGLGYIRGRYGSPANAYAFWLAQNPHWY